VILGVLMGVALVLSLGALALTLANLRLYRPTPPEADAPPPPADGRPLVSVCVPARNEAANIGACVRSLLASDVPAIEVLVYDDQSEDDTPNIVRQLAQADPRVLPLEAHPLPEGWNGKQHACWRCAHEARGDWLLFTDADVRFAPSAIRRALAAADRARSDRPADDAPLGLVSTFPRQVVASVGEALLVPMIFFLLFSYLPMARMRRTADPAASAGCGQFLLVTRACYDAFGGHAAFKRTMHDGVKMPRTAREAGYRTDLFDGTDLAHVRMYRGAAASWRGFAKNAYEGLGSPVLLVVLTAMHLLAHVAPWVVVLTMAARMAVPGVGEVLALLAVGAQITQRAVLAQRFALPAATAILHPLGVLAMTLVQWESYRLQMIGKRSWRGRVAASG